MNDTSQNISTTFGVSLKKYLAKQKKPEFEHKLGKFVPHNMSLLQEKLEREHPEGAYVFLPQAEDPLPKPYGLIDDEVLYQKGRLLEQWTLSFKAKTVAGNE